MFKNDDNANTKEKKFSSVQAKSGREGKRERNISAESATVKLQSTNDSFLLIHLESKRIKLSMVMVEPYSTFTVGVLGVCLVFGFSPIISIIHDDLLIFFNATQEIIDH